MGSNLTKPSADTAPADPSQSLHSIDIIRNGEQLLDFDESLLTKIRPPLAAAEDFHLTSDQVRNIFGIDENQFTPIPTQLVVPVLKGHWTKKKHVYHTYGWLYILEPQEWVPVIRHGNSVIASQFKSPRSTNRKDISEAKFNSDCKASIEFNDGGSYYGTSTGVTRSSDISFEYSSTSLTEEILHKKGVAGDRLVEELVLYPTLRCKATKRQRVDYTINTKKKQLEWGNDSSQPKQRERLCVPSSRLGRIAKMQFHPVPVGGKGKESMARLLPIPRIVSNREIEVATLISCADSQDWYVYEAEFQECSETIDLAASRNNVAFRPTSCWSTFLDDNRDDEPNDEPKPLQGTIDSMGDRKLSHKTTSKEERYGLEDENQRRVECALVPLE